MVQGQGKCRCRCKCPMREVWVQVQVEVPNEMSLGYGCDEYGCRFPARQDKMSVGMGMGGGAQ